MKKGFFRQQGPGRQRTYVVKVNYDAIGQDVVQAIADFLRLKDFTPDAYALFYNDETEILPTDIIQPNTTESVYQFRRINAGTITIKLLEYDHVDKEFDTTNVEISNEMEMSDFLKKQNALYLLPVDSKANSLGLPGTVKFQDLISGFHYVLVYSSK